MKVDINDRRQRKASHEKRQPFALVLIVSAMLSSGLTYVYVNGWKVTVDLQKLKNAFTVSGMDEAMSESDELQTNKPKTNENPKISTTQRIDQLQHNALPDYYVPPKVQPPIDWDIQMSKFRNTFIQHTACDPNNMKWSQMECSNFRAKAMKRFNTEWGKGAYWDGSRVIDNKTADKKVNAELSL